MLAGLKSNLDEAGEYISKLGNGVVDVTQTEYQAKKHSERRSFLKGTLGQYQIKQYSHYRCPRRRRERKRARKLI